MKDNMTKVKEAHMQAFPFIEPEKDDNIKAYHPGMTMRDEFAKAAIQGLISNPDWPESREYAAISYSEYIALMSYRIADDMMKARK